MNDIFGLTCQELQAALQPFSLPKYRAKQIAEWMYQRGATSFGDMTNLSKKLREELFAPKENTPEEEAAITQQQEEEEDDLALLEEDLDEV